MKEKYFEWEREATLQPLYYYVEAWMLHLKDYFNDSWPSTILSYSNNIVLWLNNYNEMIELGKKYFDFYSNKQNIKKFKEDIEIKANNLKKIIKEINSTELNSLENEDLLSLYKKFSFAATEWFMIGGICEPLALYAEPELKKALERLPESNKIFSILTFLTKRTFSKEFELKMLELQALLEEGNKAGEMLAFLEKNYYWIQNNYFETKLLTKDFFKEEALKALKIKKNTIKIIEKELKEEKEFLELRKKTLNELNLNERELTLIELIDFTGWFQDYRKKHTMISLHYFDLFFNEFARRGNSSVIEAKYLLPEEIPFFLNKAIPAKELKKRIQRCLLFWPQNKEKYEFDVSEKADKKFKELYSKESHINIFEINGLAANRGRIKGKAFVCMNAKDALKIPAGRILVTSMTTPDFVPALKKASALVTNEGGILCHAAIISREFGLPCIVGTKIATKVIKTNDLIEVDANHGIVRKLS